MLAHIYKTIVPVFTDALFLFFSTAYRLNRYSLGVPMGRQCMCILKTVVSMEIES